MKPATTDWVLDEDALVKHKPKRRKHKKQILQISKFVQWLGNSPLWREETCGLFTQAFVFMSREELVLFNKGELDNNLSPLFNLSHGSPYKRTTLVYGDYMLYHNGYLYKYTKDEYEQLQQV